MRAKLFDFKHMQLHADTSDFRLTEGDTASIAFRTDNVNSTVKLDERIGEFVSNGNETKVEFPVNQYICYMDRFKWYMDAGRHRTGKRSHGRGRSERPAARAARTSSACDPDQDSLSFMAPKARYDLKQHLITANDVHQHPGGRRADHAGQHARAHPQERRDGPAGQRGDHGQLRHQVPHDLQRLGQHQGQAGLQRHTATSTIVDENKRAQTIHLESIDVDTTFQTYALRPHHRGAMASR